MILLELKGSFIVCSYIKLYIDYKAKSLVVEYLEEGASRYEKEVLGFGDESVKDTDEVFGKVVKEVLDYLLDRLYYEKRFSDRAGFIMSDEAGKRYSLCDLYNRERSIHVS